MYLHQCSAKNSSELGHLDTTQNSHGDNHSEERGLKESGEDKTEKRKQRQSRGQRAEHT